MNSQFIKPIYYRFIITLLSSIIILSGSVFPQRYNPTEKDWAIIDVNSISAWITDYGSFFRNPTNGNSGFEWPKGGGVHAIYAAGLWVGALVNNEPRVAIAEYSYEYNPGNIDAETHLPNDPTDPKFRVYKIQKGITNSWDYQNWPYLDGAPLDEEGNPLLIGDQTLWMVYNDADTNAHVKMGTLPLGIEVQQTVFGDFRNYDSFDFILMRSLVINKSSNNIESAYLSLWSDPSIGNNRDDLVGCDTILSLGYCYNSSDYDSIYGHHPPAIGFQILQGPLVDSTGDSGIFIGRKIPGSNLSMSSFIFYTNTNENNGNPQTGAEVYNFMRARWRDGTRLTIGHPMGQRAYYMFSGDPVIGTGWNDSHPGNRRFIMNTGPFNLAPGDSNEMVIAVIIARGSSNLNSITELKRVASLLQAEYGSSIYKRLQYFNKKPTPPITNLVLFQNYPNPFNSQTTITYKLPINREVKLEIYNIRGQRVATIVDERQEPNTYTYTWDASGFASGVYFARLKVAQFQLTKKLLLIK